MRQQVTQSLAQELQLQLSPRMLQTLKILHLNYHELVDRISQEAEENVTLEVERKDTLLEYVRYLTSGRSTSGERDFQELEEMQIAAPKKSLHEYLHEQLALEALPKKQAEIGASLIEAMDDRGYINEYQLRKDEINHKLKVSGPTIDKVLKIVQTFEPDGVGARTVKECLLIQVREHEFQNEALEEVITRAIREHLEDLGAKRYDKVASKLDIPREGVDQIAQFIRTNLNPNPGAAFQKDAPPVIPSFELVEESGKFEIINLEKRYGPLLRLSPQYIKMLEDPGTDAKTREFLKEKITKAKTLMEDLERRYETMEKVTAIISETQQPFFERGPIWLKPLLQQEIAEQVGVHPSTISRTVSQKFLQAKSSVFPVKFLCPRRSKGASPPRIQGLIQQIVDREETNGKLSDHQITELLHKEGITIKRRTVAAYRKRLQIPSSYNRAEATADA